jgi:hypothetical protein
MGAAPNVSIHKMPRILEVLQRIKREQNREIASNDLTP